MDHIEFSAQAGTAFFDNLQITDQSNSVVPEPASVVVWSLFALVGASVGLHRKRRRTPLA